MINNRNTRIATGPKEEQDKTTKRSELVEILAIWKKNFKVPRSTPKYLEVHQSKLAEKDIKSEDVTLANDDHQVLSIL